jgi:hypothetical protein
MMYVIRDMAVGGVLRGPFNEFPFVWPGTNDECRTQLAHGLEYKPGSIVLQRVYRLVDLPPTGQGSVVTYGDPELDEDGDRYTRAVTLSRSQDDIYRDERSWITSRKTGYRDAVLSLKGHPNGDFVDGIGFVIDAILTEIVARGSVQTAEFGSLLQAIAAVKQANPKP